MFLCTKIGCGSLLHAAENDTILTTIIKIIFFLFKLAPCFYYHFLNVSLCIKIGCGSLIHAAGSIFYASR